MRSSLDEIQKMVDLAERMKQQEFDDEEWIIPLRSVESYRSLYPTITETMQLEAIRQHTTTSTIQPTIPSTDLRSSLNVRFLEWRERINAVLPNLFPNDIVFVLSTYLPLSE